MSEFNGLGLHLGNLSRLSKAQSRSISAENPTGEKGKGAMVEPDPRGPARELGVGWKCCPCKPNLEPGETLVLADITGPGAIQSMWLVGNVTRDSILRIYWDGQEQPSVETPVCDFFAVPWIKFDEFGNKGPLVLVNSLPVCVNPNRAMNCFWEMPFRQKCRITFENNHPTDPSVCYLPD